MTTHIHRSLLLLIFTMLTASVVSASKPEDAGIYRIFNRLSPVENVNRGIEYLNKSELDSALVCFSIARTSLEGKTDHSDRQYYITALEGMGIVYFCYGNYAQSFSMFSLAIDTDPEFIDAYHNLSAIYQLFGEYDRARETLATAYHKNIKKGNMKNAAVAVMNSVYIDFLDKGTSADNSIANDWLHRKLGKDSTPEEKRSRSVCQAALLTGSGRHAEAAQLLQDIVNGHNTMFMDQRNLSMIEAILSDVWDKAGILDSAFNASQRSYAMSKELGYDDLSINALNSMSRIRGKQGLDEEARRYHIMAMELADTLHNFGEYGKIKDIELQSNVSRYISQVSSEKMKRQLYQWLAIALGAIVILIVLMLVVIYRKNKMISLKDQKLFSTLGKGISADDSTSGGIESDINKVASKVTGLPEETTRNVIRKISEVMADQTTFLNPGFTLSNLAELCNESTKVVSTVLNMGLGKNFNQFLAEERIRVCIKRIKEGNHYNNWTVEAIAHDLGFLSRTNFTKVFSSITGMTPSAYLKYAAENNSEQSNYNP